MLEGSAQAILKNNRLVGNRRNGIGFFEQSGGTVQGNTLSGSEVGILVGEQAKPLLEGNQFSSNQQDMLRGAQPR